MERKIGEIFEYQGEWYQCLPERRICDDCAFKNDITCENSKGIRGECQSASRQKDGVIFKKLEKVGEPYKALNRLFQAYKVFTAITDVGNYEVAMIPHYKTIDIEIKQTKEDMEENYKAEDAPLTRLVDKYVNNLIDYETFEKAVKELYSDKKDSKPILKKFDLEAAKAGNPVCTRDGRKARIICFDRKDIKPIVALVTFINGTSVIEKAFYYFEDGYHLSKNDNNIYDLMMLPEKKERWVNVYKDSVYNTKEEALAGRSECRGYIDTIKVSWEE